MKTVSVEVRSDHIANGLREDCSRCAIALALWDAGFKNVRAYEDSFHWGCLSLFRTHFPEDAKRFIQSFDMVGTPPQPLTFELELREYELEVFLDEREA